MDFTHPIPRPAEGTEPLFSSVICGIDGSPASLEAARQAAPFAAGGRLRLVSVVWTTGTGPTQMTVLPEARARAALDEAAAPAGEIGVEVVTELIQDPEPARSLLEQASQAGLSVVGTHGGSRLAGIFFGSVASRVVHSAAGPVLVARHTPQAPEALSHLLVASDGSPGSYEATRLTGRIAARFESRVTLLRVGADSDASERHGLAVQAAELLDATGARPTIAELAGEVPELIAETARTEHVSLVVIGSRGLSGLKALGSVSERVAHTAPCSVLVARPAPDGS